MSIVERTLPTSPFDSFAEKSSDFSLEESSLLQSNTPFLQRNWGDVTDELLDISQLQDDWDGQGATAPSRKTVDRAFSLVRSWREHNSVPPSLIRPSPDGNICLEWQFSLERLEIEVQEDCIDCIEVDASGAVHYRRLD